MNGSFNEISNLCRGFCFFEVLWMVHDISFMQKISIWISGGILYKDINILTWSSLANKSTWGFNTYDSNLGASPCCWWSSLWVAWSVYWWSSSWRRWRSHCPTVLASTKISLNILTCERNFKSSKCSWDFWSSGNSFFAFAVGTSEIEILYICILILCG